MVKGLYSSQELHGLAISLFEEERKIDNLTGWFLAMEKADKVKEANPSLPLCRKASLSLTEIAKSLPLHISDNAVFAGTQRDAFARTYALINPAFKVESFSGYCDPTAVFGDIRPEGDITAERIDALRKKTAQSDYVKELSKVYGEYSEEISEVIYFVEQVTGHLIPDMRPALAKGTRALAAELENKIKTESDAEKRANFTAMKEALSAAEIFAERYSALAEQKARVATGQRRVQFEHLAKTLKKVPFYPAGNLFEAIQSFMLLWQTMCIEQAPNPFAFSVGNADRIFEPYRAEENLSREETARYLEHFLLFFNVADRSWAISQNIIVSGRDVNGKDLTSQTTYALLDAYYNTNFPQPILSVKLHKNTPEALYGELGKFWFTPGMLTPSLFNDDSLFITLNRHGIDKEDLPDYSIAGCQEPLIMGKDNGNTTNSWLNLAKIFELTLTGGNSLLSGKKLIDFPQIDFGGGIEKIKEQFLANTQKAIESMTTAADGASLALSNLKTPFLSVFMGGIESGCDLRDTHRQCTKYNGSGCLVHGLSVVTDSLVALDKIIKEKPQMLGGLLTALKNNWQGSGELYKFVKSAPKYGNGEAEVDDLAAEISTKVCQMLRNRKNYLGNSFRPDFSSPSTHLLYGYWVGATCDGRKARDMLGYGIDPLYGEAQNGLNFRLLSAFKQPFGEFNGGYASHFGIDPKNFTAESDWEKGLQFRDKIINTLFFNKANERQAPFYTYFNITTAETLRKVLANPKKYAPNGVYIMRIHGTFVNFLDLSPAIQNDIITRLDPRSTEIEREEACCAQ